MNKTFFIIFNLLIVSALSDWTGPFEENVLDSGLNEELEQPMQQTMEDEEENNLIGSSNLSPSSSSSSLSASSSNEIPMLPLAAARRTGLRSQLGYPRRRRILNGKFHFPIRYTRKPRFRSAQSLVGDSSAFGDLASVLASHYGLDKPNKVLRYGIS